MGTSTDIAFYNGFKKRNPNELLYWINNLINIQNNIKFYDVAQNENETTIKIVDVNAFIQSGKMLCVNALVYYIPPSHCV